MCFSILACYQEEDLKMSWFLLEKGFWWSKFLILDLIRKIWKDLSWFLIDSKIKNINILFLDPTCLDVYLKMNIFWSTLLRAENWWLSEDICIMYMLATKDTFSCQAWAGLGYTHYTLHINIMENSQSYFGVSLIITIKPYYRKSIIFSIYSRRPSIWWII